MQDELLRNELLGEVDSMAPILAEHATMSEKLGHRGMGHQLRPFAPRDCCACTVRATSADWKPIPSPQPSSLKPWHE
jgi:hypothetical protein